MASGATPDEGVSLSAATGGRFTPPTLWNSSAPRSENVTGPSPAFAVAGSSTRAFPAASVEGQFATPELPQSIKGEPANGRKSPPAAFVNRGLACFVRVSLPLAAANVATDE